MFCRVVKENKGYNFVEHFKVEKSWLDLEKRLRRRAKLQRCCLARTISDISLVRQYGRECRILMAKYRNFSYECPGLAATGDLEVVNPNFAGQP